MGTFNSNLSAIFSFGQCERADLLLILAMRSVIKR